MSIAADIEEIGQGKAGTRSLAREQAKVEIPGCPSPEITRPNFRFQQIRQRPDEMKRTDPMPANYHRDEDGRHRIAAKHKRGQSPQ